ncbi:sulfatase-like hydrolase/transferase [Allorhodopirellula solitaria]|uniref:Arylsulfatase n=1 Tax=Allorhodopirellula solitaria TaxID=2527987 RepID=A0A5C5YKX1_9BACT|nr:sulfatase-like hydrolase/transferase [Allorhodopirellula solitaria]TWT75438.1 Arylsulfatase precursor [Allorhodopirellula solitaria]
MRSKQFSVLAFAVAIGMACADTVLPAAERPNIILIVADDLGYSDVGFNGCKEIPTPNLDRIAESGAVFSSGYASHPYCSPSRAGLLTGRYQQRFGHECNPPLTAEFEDGEGTGLPLSERTLANALQDAGYTTGAIGKWHLGDAKPFWPNRRGFDEWFGFSAGSMSYWGDLGRKPIHFGVHRGDDPIDKESLTHLTDDFSAEAVSFVQRQHENPFFLYLAYNAPHAPDHATRQHLARTEHIEYGGRAVYGAMVAAMDEGIGRVMQKLAEVGADENTLVIFYSDNGGRREHAVNFPYRGHKGMLFEGGIRVPFVMKWPARIPSGVTIDSPVSALDIFPTAVSAAGASSESTERLDGVDLIPMLTSNERTQDPRTLFWRYAMGDEQYGYAVREGDMKLVKSAYKDHTFLFDLATDPWERNDISAEHPDTVERLEQRLAQWDEGNVAPKWPDAHGRNVRSEEATRQKYIDAASRGQK